MAEVNTINLNGTPYGIEDRESRSAQTELDGKVDNIGEQVESELAPVTAKVGELETQGTSLGARVTALESKGAVTSAKVLYENEDGLRTGTIPIPQTDQRLYMLLFEYIVSDTAGKNSAFAYVTYSTGTDVSAITLSGISNVTATSGIAYIAYRQIQIYCGTTALASFRIDIGTGYRKACNDGSSSTNDNSLLRITKVIGFYQ